jgi:hypothetical protein
MSKYRNSKPDKPKRNYESRKKRIDGEQVVKDISFVMEEESTHTTLETSIIGLYGVPGIGKSTFAHELGFALKEKYNLQYSGVYFLQCDPINHMHKFRHTMTDTWPTFRAFVDKMENSPELVKTVKMWVIDTLDGIIPKGISTICHDFGIVDMREGVTKIGDDWAQEAWTELRFELRYQILRLAALGPGVLLLSHSRDRKVTERGIEIEKSQMDVSPSIYSALGNDCAMIMRMKLQTGKAKKESNSSPRCLAILESMDEFAKDNLGLVTAKYPNGIVPFMTEREAVDKLLLCFSKVKQTKKSVKKTVKKVRR